MTGPVLLCTDGSDLAVAALTAGLDVVSRDSAVTIVAVMAEPDPMLVSGAGMAGGVMSPAEFDQSVASDTEAAKAAIETTALGLDLGDADSKVLEGSPGAAICNYAAEVDARAIVIGSRGRGGLKRAVLGSVSDHVVRHAPCPVVVVNGDASDTD